MIQNTKEKNYKKPPKITQIQQWKILTSVVDNLLSPLSLPMPESGPWFLLG